MREATAIQIMQIIAGAGCLGLAAAGVFLVGYGRGDADEHDLADSHPARPVAVRLTADVAPYVAAVRRNWPLVDVDNLPTARRSMRTDAALALAVPVDSAVTPPLARKLLIDQAVPTLPDAAVRGIADDWLREIAAVEQAKAGIRPAYATAGRDLTGAFPVVRAA